MTKYNGLEYDQLPEVLRTGMTKSAYDLYTSGSNTLVPSVRDKRGGMDLFSKLLSQRIIRLDGPVDDAMAAVFVSALKILDATPAPEGQSNEITVMINSPGGSVLAGLAMYDEMQQVKSPIRTVVSGMAASMGSVLLAGGDTRFATKNARVMIHQPSGGGRGTATDTGTSQKLIDDMWDQLTQIYVDHSGVPHETFDQLLQMGDIWLKPTQAGQLGLIDGVVLPRKTPKYAGIERKSARKHFTENVGDVLERANEERKLAKAQANTANDDTPEAKTAVKKSNTHKNKR